MNYRHAYHAGNFADVVKHVVLARVIEYMKRKPAAFRVIDTHAGAGLYDLTGAEAAKTGEWRDGVGRLIDANLDSAVSDLVEPYLAAVRAVNRGSEPTNYPGSPLIARQLIRPGDVLVANELRAEDYATLRDALRGAKSATVLNIDGWLAIKSLLPPKERRGVVLVDPPFEARDEFAKMAAAVEDALARFATGIYLFWYPVKDRQAAERFFSDVSLLPNLKYLELRFAVAAAFPGLGLTEMGLLVINPPHSLARELDIVMPALAALMSEGTGSGYRIRSSNS